MNLYYVCQNQTYKQEQQGQYLWSPQKTKSGGINIGYTNMSRVKKENIIFHGAKQQTYAISIAVSDCYAQAQPNELKAPSNNAWGDVGYRVDAAYVVLTKPLDMKSLKPWLVDNYVKDSAFTNTGECKQVYLNILNIEHARYLTNEILLLDQSDQVKEFVESIYKVLFTTDTVPVYLDIDKQIATLEKSGYTGMIWKGERLPKQISTKNNISQGQKRDSEKAARALKRANYLCEADNRDRLFLRHNGLNYTESHHLIPICKHEDFEYSLDVEENIASLCSHCHNLLHFGRLEDKQSLLKKLYNERVTALESVGLSLSFDQLLSYYRW